MKTPPTIFGVSFPRIAGGSVRGSHYALLVCLLVLLGLTAAPCPAQTPPSVAQKHNPQAQAHRDQGDKFRATHNYPGAFREYQAAYTLDKVNPAFCRDAGTDLRRIGNIHLDKAQYRQAIDFYQKALRIAHQTKDHSGEANALNDIGLAHIDLSQSEKAIGYLQQALPLYKYGENPTNKANTLYNLGLAYKKLSQYDKAVTYFQKALLLYMKVKNFKWLANTLKQLGSAYDDISQYDKAITFYQQALTIFQQVKDLDEQANELTNLGLAYDDLSQYDKAITFYQQALALDRQIKDTQGVEEDLGNLGSAYDDLSQYDKAITFYQQALALDRQIKDTQGEEEDLGNLGSAYDNLSQFDKAITFYQQALTLDQQIKDKQGQAADLGNLGRVYDDLSQYDKAIQYEQQALALDRQIKDTQGEAEDLRNLGRAYDDLSQYNKAITFYQQALPIYQQVKDREGEAIDLKNLMRVWQERDTPVLAIFYGKQSVNVYQSIRQDISSMDKDTQKTYLKAKEPTYRQLAELLIAQGRLPEAEQVLGLLKNQEFFDFVRRDASAAPAAGEATLTPIEADWHVRYQMIAGKITAIGQTKQDLLTHQQQAAKGQITLTAAEKQKLADDLHQTDADLTVANQAFQDFLNQIAQEAKMAGKSIQDRVQTVADATAFQDTLRQLGPGTVAIYTIVEPDKVRLLVVTDQTQIAREYPIKDTDLRHKVEDFRNALQHPDVDPRPSGQALYQILVKPIEQDLAGAKATTLMWSLDDVLRYIPMAALYDGKQYLVERYQDEVFTPASDGRLTETPQAQWNGLGMGVSQAYPGFPALDGVPQELDDVIHDPKVAASGTGALPGTILLNQAFTQQTMIDALEGHGYPLVHIASHFDFQPGDETDSFLLLGDGHHLSLAQIKTLPQVFQGVDLLTLSACDTANGSTADANGNEVEGFAVLAQREGARAVIASLWPVADASTPLLMETLYRNHATYPAQSKAEDLRQAQLSLLYGSRYVPGAAIRGAQVVPGKAARAFPFDPKAPFAHPFFWAPFILIGNWK